MVHNRSCMTVKPRRRGEREEEGTTKATILLLLAGEGEQSFTEIRLYLRDKYNVRSPKNLRIHLAGLREAGLIVRIGHGPGKADTYHLEKSYRGLNVLFNFFRELGRETEIMASPHFRSYVGSRDFQQKVILSIIRACILQAGEKTWSAGWQDWLTTQICCMPIEARRPVLEWAREVREGAEASIFKRNFSDLLTRYRAADVDAIHTMFFRLMAEYRQIDPLYKSEDYMIMVNEFILPTKYREHTFAMLQLSPAACDYVMNRMATNPLFPSQGLMRQVLEFLALFPEIYDFTIPEGGDTRYVDNIDQELRHKFMQRVFTFSGEPSTYVMVKALFIHDLVYGKLTCGSDLPEEIAQLIAE